jgi:hypothetical protein
MGWSDVALCLSGPVVQDLRTHFAQRWNFIYDEKYSKKATRYSRLPETSSGAQQGGVYPPPPMQQRGFEDEEEGQRGFGREEEGERGLFGHGGGGGGHFRQKIVSKLDQYGQEHHSTQSHAEHSSQRGGVDCQIARSSAKWSHNLINTEVSGSSLSSYKRWQNRVAEAFADNFCRVLLKTGDSFPSLERHWTDDASSIQFRTHTARSSGTASTSSISRTSSSSPLQGINRSPSRTRSVQLSSSALYVLPVTARSSR